MSKQLMKQWRIDFRGKKIGALGITQEYTEYVYAVNEEKAKELLYYAYEHIEKCEITLIGEEGIKWY